MTEELETIASFVRLLGQLSIRHVMVGSYASSAHGEWRSTQDVDFVADIPMESVDALYDALKDAYYIDPKSIRRAIEAGRSFNVIHLGTMLKFDVFVPRKRAFVAREIDRGQPSSLGGVLDPPVLVASPEDTVVAKLRWFRRGGEVSEQQWRDVLGVLRVQRGRLDSAYLAKTADEERVLDLLEKALAQVEGDDPSE